MERAEFETLVAEAEAEHGRIRAVWDDDFGAIVIRPATRKEVGQFAVDNKKVGEWEAYEALFRACCVCPVGKDRKELMEELPGTVEDGASAALDLAGFTRSALPEEIEEFKGKARRIAGWVDDELGLVVMRSPRRLELKRLDSEAKSPDQRMDAFDAVALSCCVSHDQAAFQQVLAKRPALSAQAAPALLLLAKAAGGSLGKARS